MVCLFVFFEASEFAADGYSYQSFLVDGSDHSNKSFSTTVDAAAVRSESLLFAKDKDTQHQHRKSRQRDSDSSSSSSSRASSMDLDLTYSNTLLFCTELLILTCCFYAIYVYAYSVCRQIRTSAPSLTGDDKPTSPLLPHNIDVVHVTADSYSPRLHSISARKQAIIANYMSLHAEEKDAGERMDGNDSMILSPLQLVESEWSKEPNPSKADESPLPNSQQQSQKKSHPSFNSPPPPGSIPVPSLSSLFYRHSLQGTNFSSISTASTASTITPAPLTPPLPPLSSSCPTSFPSLLLPSSKNQLDPLLPPYPPSLLFSATSPLHETTSTKDSKGKKRVRFSNAHLIIP